MSRTSCSLLATIAVAAVAVVVPPAPAVAQEEPEAAEAPRQFAIGPSLATLGWEESPPDRPGIDNAVLVGLSVESRIVDYLGIRFDGAYGKVEIASDTEATDANQYLLDLSLVGRAALGSFRAVGLVPFVTLGVGSVVHDPETEDRITRSQSAFTYGAGVDADLPGRFGGRLEWRRYDVSLEDVFAEGAERMGRTVSADRFAIVLYLRL